MAEPEQLGTAAAQLAGESGGGDALGDPAEDQDQFDRPPLGPVECGAGEGVEDAVAGDAAIDQDRVAVAAMDLEAVVVAAMGAGQAVGMEQADKELVTSRLVHQLADREVHGRVLTDAEGLVSTHLSRSAEMRKVLGHRFPDMSHHLLGHPPVQGKAAIETVVRDIASLSFPRNQDDVGKLLNLRCLDHARESLVSSLVVVLAKALLRKDNPILLGHEEAAMMALVAISRRHTAIYEGKMRDALPKIGATLDDATIPNIFPLLKVEPRAWAWLDDATRLRSTELCKNYKFGTANDEPILDALAIEPLKGHLIGRLKELEEGERLEVISKNPRIELVDEALTLLEESAHFRDAEPRARLALLGMGKLFSLDQVRRALNAIPSNYEIWNASKMPGIVTSFFDAAIRHFEQAKGEWSTMQYELMKQHMWHHQPEKNYASLKAKLEAAGLGPFDWEKAKAEVKAELKAKWAAQDEDPE